MERANPNINKFLNKFSKQVGKNVFPFVMSPTKENPGPKYRYIINGDQFRVVCSKCESEQKLGMYLEITGPCNNCDSRTFVKQRMTNLVMS